MDNTSKSVSWADNILQKFESMYLEVDVAVRQELQVVSANVKQLCSDLLQDVIDPSCMDAVDPSSVVSAKEVAPNPCLAQNTVSSGSEKLDVALNKYRFMRLYIEKSGDCPSDNESADMVKPRKRKHWDTPLPYLRPFTKISEDGLDLYNEYVEDCMDTEQPDDLSQEEANPVGVAKSDPPSIHSEDEMKLEENYILMENIEPCSPPKGGIFKSYKKKLGRAFATIWGIRRQNTTMNENVDAELIQEMEINQPKSRNAEFSDSDWEMV